ncbi:MAG: glutaredoxin domain-containing protein [Myxococcota bacterium]
MTLIAIVAPLFLQAVELQEPIVVEIYTRPGCRHCEAAKAFLGELEQDRPELEVVEYDIVADSEARARLERRCEDAGIDAPGVPSFLVGDTLVVGFSETTRKALRDALEQSSESASSSGVCTLDDSNACTEGPTTVDVAWLGELSVDRLGLPLFAIALGLLDGFNPCAMWVLLFLLSLLVNLHDRARMLLIAGTFVIVSGVAYFAFMAAWLNAFLLIGLSRPVQVLLGVFAIGAGAIHTKDFFAPSHGPSLSIPESAKPGIYRRARKLLNAPSLYAALLGAITLALMVNVVELLCTAGLPAIFTHVLAARELGRWEHFGYLGLYTLAYVIDDSLMVAMAVITLSRTKLQERGGRWLKLLSGMLMLVLGLVLLTAPERLF